MGEFETIRYAAENAVARITLARPQKRNAVNAAMFAELGEAAERAEADPEVRAVLLTAEGPSFCSGIDLSAIADLAGVRSRFHAFVRMAQRPYLVLSRMPKPVVVAIRGHALGAGFQLALACDLRVASEDARFAMLEARYGLVPDLGGIHHLVRLVGEARAKEIVWTARTIEAEEAARIGLVSRVVASSEVERAAEELLAAILAHSPVATGLSKGLVGRAAETSLEAELEREAQAQSQCLQSEDHREAVAAFFERRPPAFRGA